MVRREISKIKPAMPLLLILFSAMISSCYFDNQEELFVCFPEEVSYRMEVEPILKTRCYGCHDLTNAPALGDGINIEGYGNLRGYLEGNEEKFIGSLKWNGQGSPMPKNDSRLDNCSISKIEVWIEEGTRNN